VLGLLVGCRGTDPVPRVGVELVRSVPGPSGGRVDSVAWPAAFPGPVVSSAPSTDPGSGTRLQLYAVPADGSGAWEPLPVADDPTCQLTSRSFPVALPDGRLGFVQTCYRSATRALPWEGVLLMAFDRRSGETRPLRPYYASSVGRAFSFRPDLGLGLQNDGQGLHEGVDLLWPDRREPARLPFDRAGQPSWSPGGDLVAVDAVRDAGGREGNDRLALPRRLYLWRPADNGLRDLVGGFDWAGPARWTADGQWILVTVEVDDSRLALWLVDVGTGCRFELLANRYMGSAVWSPDASLIAVPMGTGSELFGGTPEPQGVNVYRSPDLQVLHARAQASAQGGTC